MLGAIGVGLRDELISDLCTTSDRTHLDFLELAPENWMGLGGRKALQLKQISDRYPLIAHGLSLSIGDTEPLNIDFILRLKQFLKDYQINIYSEHLSFGRDNQGYLYDLLPVPFYPENLHYLSGRILQVQELLGMRIALENISYYQQYPDNMSEIEFITALLKTADCDLLLDVNNVYVNSQNHGYDPYAFISALPAQRVRYLHIAGHYRQNEQLILDTHGMPVSLDVWDLLAHTYAHIGVRPTLLERDHYVPALAELRDELAHVHQLQLNTTPIRIKRAQQQLTQNIRKSHHENKSAQLYHHLISSMMDDILSAAYPRFFLSITPVLKANLLQDFLEKHACSRPLHHQLPTEFLEFLQTSSLPVLLKKIAEYEWLELSAEICPMPLAIQRDNLPLLQKQILSLSPAVSLVSLPFDIEALSALYVPLLEQRIYYRLIYVDRQHNVKHVGIEPYIARLIQLFQQPAPQKTAEDILNIFIQEHHAQDLSILKRALLFLYEQHILLIHPNLEARA